MYPHIAHVVIVVSLLVGGFRQTIELPAFAQVAPSATGSASAPVTLSTETQKVPAGTLLKVRFMQTLDSRITQQGEPFTVALSQDFPSPRKVILPAGTVIRGRVGMVKRPAVFSRGGSIALDFDHAMLPSGDLLPIQLSLALNNQMVNKQKKLYTDPGIPKKVVAGFAKGKKTFGNIRDAGIEAGKNTAGGLGLLVTVPATIAGGAIAGTAITAERAAVAVIGRGESVMITPGDEVTIDFSGAFDLTVQ
jgi:hypothetical protein